MFNFSAARTLMIEGQIRPNRVNDERVLQAFAAVPRELFVAANVRELAYLDGEIPVTATRTLMAPMALARMITAADIRADDEVLDVNGASGYSAAIMARLAARVVAVEPDAGLAALAVENLAGLGLDRVTVENGAGEAGAPAEAPFDVILVNGGVEVVPASLLDQLAEGGRLVAAMMDDDGIGRVRVFLKIAGQVSSRIVFDHMPGSAPGFRRERAFAF